MVDIEFQLQLLSMLKEQLKPKPRHREDSFERWNTDGIRLGKKLKRDKIKVDKVFSYFNNTTYYGKKEKDKKEEQEINEPART